jgi:hypothetical protein
MARQASLFILLVSLAGPALAAPIPTSAATCRFELEFQTLDALIPQVVGSCPENQHYALPAVG